jgi:hypothetical protein
LASLQKKAEQVASTLPRWARFVLRGRNARRSIQLYMKGSFDPVSVPLLERVAREFESGDPNESVLASIASLLPDLTRKLDEYGARFYANAVARYCGDKATQGFGLLWVATPPDYLARLSKPEVTRDKRLIDRTIMHDVVNVSKCETYEMARRMFVESAGLWPLGEPACLKTTWQTDEERALLREESQNANCPQVASRPAPLRELSAAVPSQLAEVFAPLKFELTFDASVQVSPASATSSLLIFQDKPIKRRFSFASFHAFRDPAPLRVRDAELTHAKRDDRLRDLVDFYASHDGGELFRSDELSENFSLMNLLGLEDQPSARASLRFALDSRRIFVPGEHARVLAQFDATLDKIIVIAHGSSTFFVPTSGAQCGQVICVYHCAYRQRVFASSFTEGLQQLCMKITRYGQHEPIGISMGDESVGGVTRLSIRTARPWRRSI